MHKYNSQDLAMMTAMLAARSALAGAGLPELWNVNEYAQCREARYADMRQALDNICLVPAKATQAA